MTDHNFYLHDAVHILRSNGTTEHADACEWAASELESLRASLTRVEEETLAAIEPFIRHGRSIENERNLRIWTDRGYREVPREDFDRLSVLKERLSRPTLPEGK